MKCEPACLKVISILHLFIYSLFTKFDFNILGQVRNGQYVESELISKSCGNKVNTPGTAGGRKKSKKR